MNTENDGTYDLRQYYAIRMTLKTDQMKPVKIRCCMHRAQMEGRHNWADSTSVVVEVQGGDWQDIVIPIVAFDYNKGQSYFLKFIEKVVLSLEYADSLHGKVELKDVCLIKAHTLLLEADIYSRPLNEVQETEYQVKVTNTSTSPQSVAFTFKNGWEGMKTEVSPSSLFYNLMNHLY